MPKLITPDGALDGDEVEQRFAAAMAADEPTEPIAAAPPRKEESSQATGPADADRRHTRARTTSASSPSSPSKTRRGKGAAAPQPPAEGHYVRPVSEFLQALTIAGALAPLPAGPTETRIRLQGALINKHTPGLATAIDAAARNNTVIRRGVEALTMGSAGWVLPAVLAVAPFAAESAGLWRGQITEEMSAAAATFVQGVRDSLMSPAAYGAGTTA